MPAISRKEPSVMSSRASSISDYDVGSAYSISTAPTDESVRPSIQQYNTSGNPYAIDDWKDRHSPESPNAEPGASVETYRSSVSSIEDVDQDADQDQDQYLPPLDLADDGREGLAPTILAASPEEFAQHFPSTQRLHIRHDDSTLDGNMNVRIDTTARTYHGREIDLTLFHLRMHDLKRREFSLRRYCRDSGREICHSRRKYSKPSVIKRPTIQRSMSNAISNLRSKSETKTSILSTGSLKRNDSGYGSLHNGDPTDDQGVLPTKSSGGIPVPTNTTRLEFSNYAHLEVQRRGSKSSKRYDFEYWGTRYSWKRVAVASGNFKEISYHLYETKTLSSMAHIVPVLQSSSEQRNEIAKGGWIPPCSMILEESAIGVSSDLADVIVASGLIALVDDCIKSRWHQKASKQISIPMLKNNYIGPKRLVDEVFNRQNKASSR